MSNMPRLNKSGIEYLDYVWNFYSGCENFERGICPLGKNCWARRRTERFKQHYPNGFNPTFYPAAFLSPMSLKKPSRIGVAFMGDLFGDWIDPDKAIPVSIYGELDQRSIELAKVGVNPVPQFPLREAIYSTIRCCPHHTFIFLTKCPWNLPKWSPFPDNCWVGGTATDEISFAAAYYHLAGIQARLKYISLEPLLKWDTRATVPMIRQAVQAGIGWLIIGAQTNPNRQPDFGAVNTILNACDVVKLPIFMKDNLAWQYHRREMPK